MAPPRVLEANGKSLILTIGAPPGFINFASCDPQAYLVPPMIVSRYMKKFTMFKNFIKNTVCNYVSCKGLAELMISQFKWKKSNFSILRRLFDRICPDLGRLSFD